MRALIALRDPFGILLAAAVAVTLLVAQEGFLVAGLAALSVLGVRVAAEAVADRRSSPAEPTATGTAVPTPPPLSRPWFHPLTRRESEVALLVAQGLTNKQIASALPSERTVDGHLTDRGVDAHVQNIMNKLSRHLGVEVNRRAQISAWVTERRPRGSDTPAPR